MTLTKGAAWEATKEDLQGVFLLLLFVFVIFLFFIFYYFAFRILLHGFRFIYLFFHTLHALGTMYDLSAHSRYLCGPGK